MKRAEIKVGGKYQARVSGNFVTVQVDAIRKRRGFADREETVYDVTNLRTGRKITFRSAAKFRKEVQSPEEIEATRKQAVLDAPLPFTPKGRVMTREELGLPMPSERKNKVSVPAGVLKGAEKAFLEETGLEIDVQPADKAPTNA